MTGEPEKILSDSADSEEARYQAKAATNHLVRQPHLFMFSP